MGATQLREEPLLGGSKISEGFPKIDAKKNINGIYIDTNYPTELEEFLHDKFVFGPDFSIGYIPIKHIFPPHGYIKTGYWLNNSYAIRKGVNTVDSAQPWNSRPIGTIKTTTITALKHSILKYGLLNPLIVAKMPDDVWDTIFKEQMEEMDRGDSYLEVVNPLYVLIDGQRRYYAIMSIIGEMRKAEHYPEQEKEILIKCLIYDYKAVEEMVRHSVEDNKFGVTPSTIYLDVAERRT